MKDINEKKELQIDNKIFTTSDIANLIMLFIGQSDKILEKSKEVRRKDLIREGWSEKNISEGYINTSHSGITLTSSDKSNYTFAFEDIDAAIKTLGDKTVTEVELQFSEKISECRFSAKLRHSAGFPGSSYILAEGKDSEWLNETFIVFKDLLEACRNQSTFVRKYRIPIIVAIIGLLSVFLVNFIKFFIKAEVSFPKIVANIFNDDLLYYVIIFAVVSATPAVLIYRWLKKLYPAVELQTGPDSWKLQKERRNKIILLFLAIIVPLAISFLIK
jgi:hypothetical protein